MNLFDKTTANPSAFVSGNDLNTQIRPVDGKDPDGGHSSAASRADHKHQLGVPSDYPWTAGVKSNGSATNITSVGTYRIIERIWVEFELVISFAGAPTAGGFILFDYPVPPIDLGVSWVVGKASFTDTGVATYGGDVYITAGSLIGSVGLYTTPTTFWSAAVPWAAGAGDKAILVGRYRKSPSI